MFEFDCVDKLTTWVFWVHSLNSPKMQRRVYFGWNEMISGGELCSSLISVLSAGAMLGCIGPFFRQSMIRTTFCIQTLLNKHNKKQTFSNIQIKGSHGEGPGKFLIINRWVFEGAWIYFVFWKICIITCSLLMCYFAISWLLIRTNLLDLLS